MNVEFRLLNDILAKTVTSKAGSFDAVTHERFLLMTSIHYGIKINWRKFLFKILKEMVTSSSKQARGFAVQICFLLKGAPDLTFGDSKTFPPLKILTVKTVGTYIAKNKSVSTTADEVTDEPVVDKVVKASAKRRPAAVADPVAKKQRTTFGRAAPTEKILAIVPVVQEVVPIFVIPAESPKAQRRQAPKRKLILQEDSDEEATDEQEKKKERTAEMETVEKKPEETEKDVEETVGKETDVKEKEEKGKDAIDSEDTEPLSKVLKLTKTSMSDKESMTIVRPEI
ncbi:hypothetical protein F511_10041 [Dorcoceras hygrometricum]|uniref:Splicing factor 3B subunit 1-like n=1 Tax=Dorcoceras hygrometricum TaxID=472368 RepID=A0A2Z7ABQ7_9LAMI|nr:hypothetical protein F511_10041 [Dorcoceras hygrometricum]